MDGDRPTLLRLVLTVLHKRQFVVFFAIGLYALDVLVPLLSAWLYHGGSLATSRKESLAALADAVASHSGAVAGVFLAYLLLKTWLRAGYVRSLTGPFRIGAASWGQFARLLGLEVILEVVAATAVGAVVLTGGNPAGGGVAVLAVMAIYLALLYADYIVVIAGVGPVRAVALSVRTVRLSLLPSLFILLTVTVIGDATSRIAADAAAGVAQAAPLFLVQCMVMGSVVFVADVVLVVIYLSLAESGRLAPSPDEVSS